MHIKVSRSDFIGRPYTFCPRCYTKWFGVFLGTAVGNRNSFLKECVKCGYRKEFKLPNIRKKVIYLDQFVFDNIVKILDKTNPKNESALKEPFWMELFNKLEVATRAQLVVCPDSFFHQEESGPTNYFEKMQRIYEHFSGGVTFDHYEEIVEKQICEHFENYLNGNSNKEPETDSEKIVHGKLHEWHGRMQISINKKPKKDQVEEFQKINLKKYQNFIQVFERWKTEKHKQFHDWYKEENEGFASGTFLVIKKYYERQASLPQRILEGEKIDLNDIFPPPSLALIEAMSRIAHKNGLVSTQAKIDAIRKYLFSDNLEHIQVIRIGSLLYAGLADQAARGRITPPTPGVVVDVDMISSLLPYCDAIFLDKENANILNDGRVKEKIGCCTKIFSLRNKGEFLQYLDDIITSMTPEHLIHIRNYYGSDWNNPYTRILKDN